MTLHLIKVAAGIRSTEQMRAMQATRLNGGHVQILTANMPKRADELVNGGSIFWIISRRILLRQTIADIEQRAAIDGKKVCLISLSPELIDTVPTGRSGFQGWRYLDEKDAPADMPAVGETGELPTHMIEELRRLGLM